MLFLSGCQFCVRMVYTLPQVIKEEKRDEEEVGKFGIEKREGGETESEEEKHERRFRGDWFLFFIFCLRDCRERIV